MGNRAVVEGAAVLAMAVMLVAVGKSQWGRLEVMQSSLWMSLRMVLPK